MTDRGGHRSGVRRQRWPSLAAAGALLAGAGALGALLGAALIGPAPVPRARPFAAALMPATVPAFPADAGASPVPDAQPLLRSPVASVSFDAARALASVRTIESFGVRAGGSAAELATAHWLRDQLEALGYDAWLEDVPLTTGATSHNVIARAAGSSPRVVVLGAHLDSKAPSPGANDNASGCAALLEIARVIAEQPVVPTVEIVFFGCEEVIDGDPDHHHFGSRTRVAAMNAAERANTAGMVSIDMIAYGPSFHVRTMLEGPRTMADLLLARAAATGVRMTFLADPGATGWSDHEAYELAGIPAAWIEWRDDPVYHTADDTSAHCSGAKIRTAGQLVLDVLRSLDATALERLVAR